METEYIVCSSITYALKGQDILQRYGISSSVVKPPKLSVGCGYSLAVDARIKDTVLNILKAGGIKLAKTARG
ncbi:MAG: DUF3343 domain-containing protein [Clostridia bacterium]